MRQRRTVIRLRIIPCPGPSPEGSYAQEPWEEETFPTEDGYEYNDWEESTWQQYPAEEYDDWEEDADLEAGESDWIHWDVLDPDVLDSYVEEECTSDKNLYEAHLGYKEARDTLNQVGRGRGFWPVIAIPALDGRSATLAVRNTDESFRGKGETAKTPPTKARAKEARVEKVAKAREAKARAVARLSRPPVGTGVSQAQGVEPWTVAPSAENAETRLKLWISQEIQEKKHESHGCHHDHA